MTNIFKQLIAPWLLALLLAWLLLLLWLNNESRNQQLQQIQQLAITVNYAVQANLSAKNDQQQLANQLKQIQLSSTLGVAQIAAYNTQLQLIASSVDSATVPALTTAPKTYQVSALDGERKQIAVLPVSAGLAIAQSAIATPLPDNGYIAVVFSTAQPWLIWLIPLTLLTAALAIGLACSSVAIRREQVRLATDVELLAHNLRRLQNARQDCQISQKLVPALKPLRLAFNQLAGKLDQHHFSTEQLIQQLNQRVQQHNNEVAGIEQQRSRLATEQKMQRRQICHWFEQSLLLWQRRDQLQHVQLQRLSQMHLLAGFYQLADADAKVAPIKLSDWLGQYIAEFNELAATGAVILDWQEHPDNLVYAVKICGQTLRSQLHALIMLSLRGEDVSKITITIQLQLSGQQPALRLIAGCNGNGLPAHCRELIQTNDVLDLQWSDADIALLKAIRKTGGEFTFQSLDGLGCILQLTTSVQIEPVNPQNRLQHILVFDADEERLQQRSAALAALTSQLTTCHKLIELEQIIHSKKFDVVLLFLPPATERQHWHKITDYARQQSEVLCFAAADTLTAWQQTLSGVQASDQFCLAVVQALGNQLSTTANRQHILVVDDNETNLAFVQVLLKNKPLVLHTATSAAQVFLLCEEQRFDMILLDIQLPDMSGVEITKQLRQLPQYRQTPIVAFTAHAMPAEIATYREAGMDDIVFKPLEPARLDSLLARFSLTSP
ncbi:response regulator [Arsukibacterium sp.]|uniref:response regulator n=1 Tax=Arsukibacterium sp. TaxID=1977258 RepID=UPI0035679784